MTMKLHLILFACLFVPGVAAANAEDDDVQTNIVSTYLKLANQGDTFAQYFIAHRYEIGKGVPLDLGKALFWYEKAAAKGHPLARQKVAELRPAPATQSTVAKTEKVESVPAKPARAPAAATPPPTAAKPTAKPPAPRPTAAEKPSAPPRTVVAETTPAAAPVVAKAAEIKAPAEPPAPSVNIMSAILGGTWSRAGQPAEFLPSTNAACLPSSASEIVCFSQELTRNAAGTGLTYAVKSTLSGFNDREGKFVMTYVYDVLRVASSPYTETKIDNSAGDITAKPGWQEPWQRLECRLSDEKSLSCARPDRAFSYQFVRN